MSNGNAGETMLGSILESMGFEDKSQTFDKKVLLETVKRIRPGRIQNVERQRSKVGKPTNWNVTSQRLVLDWLYGLDCVIDADGNGRLFAIDFTVDPESINKKVKKLKEFKKLWKAIGIEKVAVVLAVPPSCEFGLGLLTQKQRQKIEDDLYEVIFSIDESSLDVSKHIVSW